MSITVFLGVGFEKSKIDNDNPFVKEIIRTGTEISMA